MLYAIGPLSGSQRAPLVRSVERRYIKCRRADVIPEDEPTVVRQKSLQIVPLFVSGCVQPSDWFRHASGLDDTVDQPIQAAEQDHAVSPPRSSRALIEGKWRIAERGHRAPAGIDPLHLSIRKECQRSTVR